MMPSATRSGIAPFHVGDAHDLVGREVLPRERRLPREVLRLHDIIARNGSIGWASQVARAFCGRRRAGVRQLGICRSARESRRRLAPRLH